MMGLILSVYRDADFERRGVDCTLNGISSQHERFVAVNVPGPFDPEKLHYPAVLVLPGPGGGPVVYPAVKDDNGEWVKAPGLWMAGGNYAATSDSRFSEACKRITPGFYGAAAIHDRQEHHPGETQHG